MKMKQTQIDEILSNAEQRMTNQAGALLLLVSCPLLWKNVASVPLSSNDTDDYQELLNELFDHAQNMSQNIGVLNLELRRVYTVGDFTEKLYHRYVNEFIEDQEFMMKTLTCCHKYSMKTPENIDEAQEISLDYFPKLILSRLQAWNETLQKLQTILGSTPDIPNGALSLAKDIKGKMSELFEDSKNILSSIYGRTENVESTVYSGLEDLNSPDQESRFFAICKFSYCLRRDMHTVDICLQLLRCVVLVNNDCRSIKIEDTS
ncbi:prolactin-7A2-like [Psammomys obesus]|uniref:prolactin-7A2-like n=1 Tax=Psammomys obesus TaxID=48139 RepID=UPI00245318E1|nr:prolactin-7A2-like [Psammomys obesus]